MNPANLSLLNFHFLLSLFLGRRVLYRISRYVIATSNCNDLLSGHTRQSNFFRKRLHYLESHSSFLRNL